MHRARHRIRGDPREFLDIPLKRQKLDSVPGDDAPPRHVARWSVIAGDRIEFLPFQGNVEKFPGITTDAVSRAVHLIEPDGTVMRGAEAVFRIAALNRKRPWLRWAYEN